MTKLIQIELKGFSRTIAELEWLLLILVLLYYIVHSAVIVDTWSLFLAMIIYASFVISFRYSNLFTQETHWKLAVETWAILLFITWVVHKTGGIDSPLLNLYLLLLMFSALTLGKRSTVLVFLLVTAVYFYLGHRVYAYKAFSFSQFGEVMVLFCPFLLAGYVTSLLAADLQNAREELTHLSLTDDLTGLKNRRAFENEYSTEVKKSMRNKRPFTVMILDADNLKLTNDKHGHDIGDKLIVSLSDALKDSLRDTDILARLGGDEFVIMLPETTDGEAIFIAERIRKTAECTSFSANGEAVSSTFSIGIACYPDDSPDSNEIIKLADKAMYESKNKGKNSVTRIKDINRA